MCNEIEETLLVEQFMVTMCGIEGEDPVPVTLYPVFPNRNENDLLRGGYSRTDLIKEGIEIIQYETFLMETWRVGSLLDVRIRPHVRRPLSKEMIRKIHEKVLANLPDEGDGVVY